MFKKIIVTCLILTLIIGPVNSFASTSIHETSNLERNEVINFLSEHYVPKEKIDLLISKLENGTEWDCYRQENLDSIPMEFYEMELDGNEMERYYRFPDGSFVNVHIGEGEVINDYNNRNANIDAFSNEYLIENLSNKTIAPMSSFGTLYKNHKVSRIVGTTSAYFYASFYVARTGPSMIYTYENSSNLYNSPYGENIKGFGANANPSKEMIRDVEYNGNAALFRLFWFTQIEVSGGWGPLGGKVSKGGTCNLYLALVNNKLYISPRLPF